MNSNSKITAVEKHGKLSVSGTKIIDKNGEKVVLKGVSTHGIQWYERYINEEAFLTLRDDWGINLIRLAMYTEPEADKSEPMPERTRAEYVEFVEGVLERGVELATKLGMYVIVDWHILSDGNPNKYKDRALKFFKKYCEKYKDYDNVLYEICNEPNGDVQWRKDVKPYACEIVSEIRKIDKEKLIIIGTPNWSQDVDIAADDPIVEYKNLMYTVHFYAATHKEELRAKMKYALSKKIPVFLSEFSICDASGNGEINYDEGKLWMDALKENDISYAIWQLTNKNETSSLIKTDCKKISGWTYEELSETGKWFVDFLKKN